VNNFKLSRSAGSRNNNINIAEAGQTKNFKINPKSQSQISKYWYLDVGS